MHVFMSRPTLAQRFDPRRNSLSMLRLILAGTVALVHAQAIGWGDQPRLGQAQIGDLAVDGFFVISGFLVTRSAVGLPTIRRFAWHRAMRILPAFWVCLAVTAFVAAPLIAWLNGLSPTVVLSEPESSFGFVGRNAGLLTRQWGIAGLLGEGDEAAMNGALWTLFYEALCYAAIGAMVAVGLIRRGPRARTDDTRFLATLRATMTRLRVGRIVPGPVRRHPVLAITAAVWAAHTVRSTGIASIGPDYLIRFLLLFLLGSLGHLYAHRIRFNPALLVSAVTVLAVSLTMFFDYRPLGAPAFAYLFLWAIVALPLRWSPATDVSYGIYVYHWPAVQVLTAAGATAAGRPAFTLAALAATTLLALFSWHLVEGPALRQKHAAWIDTLPERVGHRALHRL